MELLHQKNSQKSLQSKKINIHFSARHKMLEMIANTLEKISPNTESDQSISTSKNNFNLEKETKLNWHEERNKTSPNKPIAKNSENFSQKKRLYIHYLEKRTNLMIQYENMVKNIDFKKLEENIENLQNSLETVKKKLNNTKFESKKKMIWNLFIITLRYFFLIKLKQFQKN